MNGLETPTRARSRLAVCSWCLFDFANSSYTTLIITVAYAVYFRDVVVNAQDNRGDQLWGVANFLAMLVVAVLSPLAVSLADWSGRKKLFLVVSTLLTVVTTALLMFVGPGDVWPGMLLFILATIGFEIGYVFYNAFLPEICAPEAMGRVSGWGWAVGYAGGLLCLVLCQPWITRPLRDARGVIDASGVSGYQASFAMVAVFYLVFALPAFVWLRESAPQGRSSGWVSYAAIGFRRVGKTLRELRRYRETAKYVIASLFFTDGITTVISFAAIYATTTMGFTNQELVWLFLVMNVVAFPGALAAGYAADAIGARRTIILTLIIWISVVFLGFAAVSKTQFWVMAFLAALGMGSTQAVGRSFMAEISPPSRRAEFFGFYSLSGKFASMLGPLLFGTVSRVAGSQRLAVLSMLPFFVIGLALMFWIDEKNAKRSALLNGDSLAS